MTLPPFENVVEQHGQMVLRVCRAVVGYDEADDVWSETFLAALRAYPDLDPAANVAAWLVTIAKRKGIDQHRRTARNPIPVERIEAAPVTPPEYAELWSQLRELPGQQREAVAYHHIGGLSFAGVAEILGVSVAAARRASSDGVQKLRERYRGESA